MNQTPLPSVGETEAGTPLLQTMCGPLKMHRASRKSTSTADLRVEPQPEVSREERQEPASGERSGKQNNEPMHRVNREVNHA
jgi:hypothetical protein